MSSTYISVVDMTREPPVIVYRCSEGHYWTEQKELTP